MSQLFISILLIAFVSVQARYLTSRDVKLDAQGTGTFEGHTYTLYLDSKLSWNNAELECEKDSGKLASAETKEELDFIRELLNTEIVGRRIQRYWLGGYKAPTNKYQWISGDNVVDDFFWAAGMPQPVTGPGARCTELFYTRSANTAEGRNELCSQKLSFICKSSGEVTTEHSTTDDVSSTTEDVSPTTEDVSPTTEDVSPSTEDVSPSTEDVSPSTEDVSPTTEDVSPSTEDVSPTTEDVSPTTEDVSPTTEDVSPTTEDVSPTTEDDSSTASEEPSTTDVPTSTTTTKPPPFSPSWLAWWKKYAYDYYKYVMEKYFNTIV